ncbi:MAG: hypothetical protein J2P41_03215 [Blastocatellia bacterium]|nr:hypothetical protein [Blastocatellia bacterium]
MKFSRLIFLIAGIYGLIILLPLYFMEGKTSRDYPPAITHPEYYYGFIGVAVAWQICFLIVSRDPRRYRPIMLAALAEKLAWGIATIALYLQDRITATLLILGVIDLLLGMLFLLSYYMTRSDERTKRYTSE